MQTLTVISQTQLSLPKQLAHLILGDLRSTSCVLPPSIPPCPPGSQAQFVQRYHVQSTYLASHSTDQPVGGIHYMSTESIEFEHFSHYHTCVPLLQCILRSCFPVARSYLNLGLFFLPQYLFGYRIFWKCVFENSVFDIVYSVFENELLLPEFCWNVKHMTLSNSDVSWRYFSELRLPNLTFN